MRSSEETLNLITELVRNKDGEFILWFEDKKFYAQLIIDGVSCIGVNSVCAESVNEMLDKVLESNETTS
jgi:hypothetical protein